MLLYLFSFFPVKRDVLECPIEYWMRAVWDKEFVDASCGFLIKGRVSYEEFCRLGSAWEYEGDENSHKSAGLQIKVYILFSLVLTML